MISVTLNDTDFGADISLDSRNERILVLSCHSADLRSLALELDNLAHRHGAGKTIIYASENDWRKLLPCGYRLEGVMSGYYRGEPAFCMSRFYCPERASDKNILAEDLVVKGIYNSKRTPAGANKNRDRYLVRPVIIDDIENIREIFALVFATYPSPVEDKSYIEYIIKSDCYVMKAVEFNGKIVGIASADINYEELCAELTDCAVLPEHRGHGLMGRLIGAVEQEMKDLGIKYLYSLTRAGIPEINAVFYHKGYRFNGKLLNNCNIGGQFESMNIWEKKGE